MTESNDLDLRRFFRAVLSLKWVYLLSFIILMGLAVTYCLVKQPQYVVKSTMLIEDSSGDNGGSLPMGNGNIAAMMRTFSIGGFGSSSVDNEVMLVNSHEVLIRTARALGLNRSYLVRDGLSKEMIYPLAQVAVDAPEEMFDTLTRGMKVSIDLLGNNRADVKVTRGLLGRTIGKADNALLPVTVDTEFGPLRIIPTSAYTDTPQRLDVSVSGYEAAADYLMTEIDVDIADKRADAITFEFLYPNRERGKAILNTLMAQYNSKRLGRQHETALIELEFLTERIDQIAHEIDSIDNTLKEFRKANNVVALDVEGGLLAEATITARTQMAELAAKEMYYQSLLAQLDNPDRADDPLPAFDENSYTIVKDYNDLLLQKKNLSRSALPGNAAYDQAASNLLELRQSVMKNISGMLEGVQMAIKSQTALEGTAESRINQFPELEQNLTEISRQRTLKNALYMFLLERRENALLKLYSNSTLGFVVDSAYTEVKPSKKKAIIVLIAALLLSLVLPTCMAIWSMFRRNRVYQPMDLASCGLEKYSIMLTPDGGSVNGRDVARLRTMLTHRPERRVIYTAGSQADTVVAALRQSCAGVDITTEILNAGADNDQLLTNAFGDKLREALAKSDLVFVPIPAPEELKVLRSNVESDQAQLLLCVERGEALRSQFRSELLSRLATNDSLTVAIVG